MALLHIETYAAHRPVVFTEQDRRELDQMSHLLFAYDVALERLQSDLNLIENVYDGMVRYPNDPGLRHVFEDSLVSLGYSYSIEGALQTMWDGIKKFFATIIEKIKQFFLWVARLFGFCKTEADKSGAILKELKSVLELFNKADQNKKTAILEKITEYRKGGAEKVEQSTQSLLDVDDVWEMMDANKPAFKRNLPEKSEAEKEKQKEAQRNQDQGNDQNNQEQQQQQNVEPPPVTNATSAAGKADKCYLSELPVVANTIAALKDKAAAFRPALSKYVDGLKGIQNLANTDTFANAQSGNLEGGQQLTEAAKAYVDERAKFDQAQEPSGSDSYVKFESYETLNTNIGNYEGEAKQIAESTKLLASELERIQKLQPPAETGAESLWFSFEAGEAAGGGTKPPANPGQQTENNGQTNPNQPSNNINSGTAKQIIEVIKKSGKDVSDVMKNIVRIENDCANTRSNFNKMMGSVVKIIAEGLKESGDKQEESGK